MMCLGDGMMFGDGMMSGGWWIMGLLWMLILVGGLGLIAWAIVRAIAGGTRDRGTSENSALEILSQRFARGEIDEEEYRARRNLLEQ